MIYQWDGGGFEAHDYLDLSPLILQTLTTESGFVPPPVTPDIDRGVRRRRKPLPAFLAPAPRPPEEALPPPVVEVEIPVARTPEAPLLAEAIARSMEPPPIIAAQIALPPALKTKPRKAVDVIDDDDDEILMMM